MGSSVLPCALGAGRKLMEPALALVLEAVHPYYAAVQGGQA